MYTCGIMHTTYYVTHYLGKSGIYTPIFFFMTKQHHHYKLYKPDGFVSQFVYPHKRKKGLLGDLHPFADGTMSIGRLDVDSEGLLLLTTDGKVSYAILSGAYDKEYYVQVDGIITQDAIDQMKKGVTIGIQGSKYKTKPCEAELIEGTPDFPPRRKKIRDERHGPTSWAKIILREGKYRQVRKMTAAVGFPTLRLVRNRIGPYLLEDMQPGEVRPLSF